MSALSLTGVMTLKELANRLDPGKKMLLPIVEALSQKNTLIDDAVFEEANNGTNHLIVRRTYEPAGSERYINQGVAATSSRTEQFMEPSCVIEDWSETDELLINLAANKEQARFNEDVAHLEGMRKRFAQRLLYGTGQGLQIAGIQARFNTVDNVSCFDNSNGNASVTANKTSLYVVQWGQKTCHCFYPKGMANVGISAENKGKVTLTELSGTTTLYRDVYRTKFQHAFGLAVKDVRAVQRLANISTTNVDNVDDFSVDSDRIIDMLVNLPYSDGVKTIIYCNRIVYAQLWKMAKDKINVDHDPANPEGKPLIHFGGYPLRIEDQIVSTEAAVA